VRPTAQAAQRCACCRAAGKPQHRLQRPPHPLPPAQIVKFNCNAYNKELGKTLAIKVAPTFHLYKGGEKVAEMTGAKMDKLRSLIEANV
jgi:hypothetical protein